MMEQEFTGALKQALLKSLDWIGHKKHCKSMNSYRSAYFCYQAGLQLDKLMKNRFPAQCLKWKQIKFDRKDEKIPGEWLLDGVWCEETQPDQASKSKCPSKIYCALECESNTSAEAFFEDFAKLVHMRSKIKVFLAGVNQGTKDGMKHYIDKRTKQAAQFLVNTGVGAETEEWYLAFWPSPAGDAADHSVWDDLDENHHLNATHAFSLKSSRFVQL